MQQILFLAVFAFGYASAQQYIATVNGEQMMFQALFPPYPQPPTQQKGAPPAAGTQGTKPAATGQSAPQKQSVPQTVPQKMPAPAQPPAQGVTTPAPDAESGDIPIFIIQIPFMMPPAEQNGGAQSAQAPAPPPAPAPKPMPQAPAATTPKPIQAIPLQSIPLQQIPIQQVPIQIISGDQLPPGFPPMGNLPSGGNIFWFMTDM